MKKVNLLSKVCLFALIVLCTIFCTLTLLSCSNDDNSVPVYTGPPPDLDWSFDSETIEDSTVHDVTTNTYDGTMNSGVTSGQEGVASEAVVFDGTTGIINGDLPKTNTFTVSVGLSRHLSLHRMMCEKQQLILVMVQVRGKGG